MGQVCWPSTLRSQKTAEISSPLYLVRVKGKRPLLVLCQNSDEQLSSSGSCSRTPAEAEEMGGLGSRSVNCSTGSCSSTSSCGIRRNTASAAHQDLLGLLRNPEAVVAVKPGKLLMAERAGRLKLVIRLKQKTQSQGIPLGMEKVSQHHNQIRHDAFPYKGNRWAGLESRDRPLL